MPPTTGEEIRGIAGSAGGLLLMFVAWIKSFEDVIRVASMIAGLILTCVMIRYWLKKTKKLDSGDKSES